jgi:hypothetical protein
LPFANRTNPDRRLRIDAKISVGQLCGFLGRLSSLESLDVALTKTDPNADIHPGCLAVSVRALTIRGIVSTLDLGPANKVRGPASNVLNILKDGPQNIVLSLPFLVADDVDICKLLNQVITIGIRVHTLALSQLELASLGCTSLSDESLLHNASFSRIVVSNDASSAAMYALERRSVRRFNVVGLAGDDGDNWGNTELVISSPDRLRRANIPGDKPWPSIVVKYSTALTEQTHGALSTAMEHDDLIQPLPKGAKTEAGEMPTASVFSVAFTTREALARAIAALFGISPYRVPDGALQAVRELMGKMVDILRRQGRDRDLCEAISSAMTRRDHERSTCIAPTIQQFLKTGGLMIEHYNDMLLELSTMLNWHLHLVVDHVARLLVDEHQSVNGMHDFMLDVARGIRVAGQLEMARWFLMLRHVVQNNPERQLTLARRGMFINAARHSPDIIGYRDFLCCKLLTDICCATDQAAITNTLETLHENIFRAVRL